jgi:hypothetical protein
VEQLQRLQEAPRVAAVPPLGPRLESLLEWGLQRAFRPRAQPLQAAQRPLAQALSLPESMAQPENTRTWKARPPAAPVEPPEVEAQLPAWLLREALRAAPEGPQLLSVV